MFTYPVQTICTFSCTSVFFINIYYPQYTVLHILSHCTFYTFYFIICSLFHSHLYLYIFSCVMFHCFIAYVIFILYFIIIMFFFLHFPLSGPVPTYISLLIIPCMIVYVTNNKEPWTPRRTSEEANHQRLYCINHILPLVNYIEFLLQYESILET